MSRFLSEALTQDQMRWSYFYLGFKGALYLKLFKCELQKGEFLSNGQMCFAHRPPFLLPTDWERRHHGDRVDVLSDLESVTDTVDVTDSQGIECQEQTDIRDGERSRESR